MSRRVILNFHGIGAPERALEPGEAPYWISEAFFREILDLIPAAPLPVAITFDDGNVSDLAIAAPLLAARGLGAEVFALSGRLGRAGSLSAEGLRELEAMGMRIGTHGVDHLNWRALPPAALAREIVDSRARLAEAVGRDIDAAAIPFGAYGAGVLGSLREAGLARVFTSDGGVADRTAWLQPRTSVRADMDAAAISAILLDRASPLRRLRRAAGMAAKRRLG